MNPSKIVITGTIASGKSTLSYLLSEFGFTVISADEINRELIAEGNINYLAIKNSGEFDDAFKGDELDKKELAAIIFNDSKKMQKLNQLTHKNILDELIKRANLVDDKVVFVEIPLFFQTEERFLADEVWLVVADYKTQVDRLKIRDGIDEAYAKTKIESQETLIEMKNESDMVFDNSGTLTNLRNELENVLEMKGLI